MEQKDPRIDQIERSKLVNRMKYLVGELHRLEADCPIECPTDPQSHAHHAGHSSAPGHTGTAPVIAWMPVVVDSGNIASGNAAPQEHHRHNTHHGEPYVCRNADSISTVDHGSIIDSCPTPDPCAGQRLGYTGHNTMAEPRSNREYAGSTPPHHSGPSVSAHQESRGPLYDERRDGLSPDEHRPRSLFRHETISHATPSNRMSHSVSMDLSVGSGRHEPSEYSEHQVGYTSRQSIYPTSEPGEYAASHGGHASRARPSMYTHAAPSEYEVNHAGLHRSSNASHYELDAYEAHHGPPSMISHHRSSEYSGRLTREPTYSHHEPGVYSGHHGGQSTHHHHHEPSEYSWNQGDPIARPSNYNRQVPPVYGAEFGPPKDRHGNLLEGNVTLDGRTKGDPHDHQKMACNCQEPPPKHRRCDENEILQRGKVLNNRKNINYCDPTLRPVYPPRNYCSRIRARNERRVATNAISPSEKLTNCLEVAHRRTASSSPLLPSLIPSTMVLPFIVGLSLLKLSAAVVCHFDASCTCTRDHPNLGEVDCSNTRVSLSRINASKLYSLALVNNQIDYLPSNLFEGTGLYRFHLSHNAVYQLEEDVFSGVEYALWELHLTYCKLSEIPFKSIRHLQKLRTLNLT
ncbi:hypothetical protein GE061_002611, partial [Apolygus lucorum]